RQRDTSCPAETPLWHHLAREGDMVGKRGAPLLPLRFLLQAAEGTPLPAAQVGVLQAARGRTYDHLITVEQVPHYRLLGCAIHMDLLKNIKALSRHEAVTVVGNRHRGFPHLPGQRPATGRCDTSGTACSASSHRPQAR